MSPRTLARIARINSERQASIGLHGGEAALAAASRTCGRPILRDRDPAGAPQDEGG